jgi:glycosyltransferase involved in cell wall biosynthesis
MVVAVALVRDEADIIADTVGHMVGQVDHVIVADNGSIDGTREILPGLGVEVLDDPEPGYWQSQKMTALAERAIAMGADWVVPFDADELWIGEAGTIAETLRSLPAEAQIAAGDLFDHVPTSRDDPSEASPVRRMRWRRAARCPLPKVCVRARPGVVIHQGNHAASLPGVRWPLTVTGALQVRHYPVRSPGQLISKARNGAAAYAATNLPATVGGHWRRWGAMSDPELEELYAVEHLVHAPRRDRSVVCDPPSGW